jgi:colicin import membrane protein
MRAIAWLGSVLIHVLALVFLFFGNWQAGTHTRIDLEKRSYPVHLVSMKEARGQAAGGGEPEKARAPVSPKKEETAEKPKKKPNTPPARKEKAPEPAKKISPQKSKTSSTRKRKEQAEPEDPRKVLDEALASARKTAGEEETEKNRETVDRALAEVQAGLQGGGNAAGPGASAGADPMAVYISLVGERIKDNWRFPAIGPDPGLAARVRIEIDDKGRIVGQEVIESSGRENFDSSVLRAVEETRELPEPPGKEIREIVINFNLEDQN